MKIKVGDQVKIIAGKDRNKTGKVIKTLRKEDKVIVENINIPFAANGYEYEMIETTSCILEGKTESAVHPHSHSLELCKMMDDLRGDWGMKYPFEKN